MISFENRVLYEYKIKTSKIDTLVKSIMIHRNPNSQVCKDASKFLDVLILEIDQYCKSNDDVLSNNGKRPHPRSRLSEVKNGMKMWRNFWKRIHDVDQDPNN